MKIGSSILRLQQFIDIFDYHIIAPYIPLLLGLDSMQGSIVGRVRQPQLPQGSTQLSGTRSACSNPFTGPIIANSRNASLQRTAALPFATGPLFGPQADPLRACSSAASTSGSSSPAPGSNRFQKSNKKHPRVLKAPRLTPVYAAGSGAAAGSTLPADGAKDFFAEEGVGFEDLGLNDTLLDALNGAGFSRPSKIQELSAPSILSGKNTVITAETGSGEWPTHGKWIVAGAGCTGMVNIVLRQ